MDMSGKVCLVTGATSGLGQATARELGRRGATVLLVARDRIRGESELAQLTATGARAELFVAELSAQGSIRELAANILARHDALHVLVNNAGCVNASRRLTIDGIEWTFAVNHLAPFLLTNLLLELLTRSAPARIVNVSSSVHWMGRIDFDDPQRTGHRYGLLRAYSQSKLANVLFTYELARRLSGTGVTATCLHPGVTRTRLASQWTGAVGLLTRAAWPFLHSPAEGAATQVFLATAPEIEGITGRYFAKCRPARSSGRSRDRAAAERLWTLSAKLTGL